MCIFGRRFLFCCGSCSADRTVSRVGTLLSSYEQASQWQQVAVGDKMTGINREAYYHDILLGKFHHDLTATSLESWLVRGMIPKWP